MRAAPAALCLSLLGLFLVPVAAASEDPRILEASVSGITETSATLEAIIDPGEGDAYYQFQMGAEREDLAAKLLCPSKFVPPSCEGEQSENAFPIGGIEGGAHEVKLGLEDLAEEVPGAILKPGTGYRFRVVAARAVPRDDGTIQWVEPTVVGMSKWFTTLGGPESAVWPTSDDLVINGSAPLTKCKKAGSGRLGRCSCGRGLPQTVKGKVRCVKSKGPLRSRVKIAVRRDVVHPGGHIRVRIENGSAKDIRYGLAYGLQRFKGGRWVKLLEKSVLSVAYGVPAGEVGAWQAIRIPVNAIPGRYRVRKTVLRLDSGPSKEKAVYGYFSVRRRCEISNTGRDESKELGL